MSCPCQRSWFAFLISAILVTAPSSSRGGEGKPRIDFAHDIMPLLKARCAECHTNGKYKAGLSFDTREELLKGKAVVPGKSAASELFKRVSSKDKDFRMPPKGEPLSPKEVELFRAWIDEGLAWDAG